jgi:hypothetical protein
LEFEASLGYMGRLYLYGMLSWGVMLRIREKVKFSVFHKDIINE